MINGEKILAVIPARGGSKGIPGKNIRPVGGKPLLAWSIDAAKSSNYLDRIILSSDDKAIIETARQYGCDAPFVRPESLATDETPGVEPIIHALQELPGYDYVVVLQPTSPLRLGVDIDRALEVCVKSTASSCVSVTEAEESPHWMYHLSSDNRLKPVLGSWDIIQRRQELPASYVLNGAVYVARVDWLMSSKRLLAEGTVAYVMPRARSVDIDTEKDLYAVEAILKEKHL